MQFTPCPTPSNQYAFTGFVYMSPTDFEKLRQQSKYKVSKNAQDILVSAGRFILKAEPLN